MLSRETAVELERRRLNRSITRRGGEADEAVSDKARIKVSSKLTRSPSISIEPSQKHSPNWNSGSASSFSRLARFAIRTCAIGSPEAGETISPFHKLTRSGGSPSDCSR